MCNTVFCNRYVNGIHLQVRSHQVMTVPTDTGFLILFQLINASMYDDIMLN